MEKKIRETELNVIFEVCRVIGQALKLDQALGTILGSRPDRPQCAAGMAIPDHLEQRL